ncbi:MAG: hypothetical protein MZV64_13035 [Ignavibacteriales bacterium]|nr:hypothetical protein [Ignavibacteriales bacterium]
MPRSKGIREEWFEAIKNGTRSTTDFSYSGPLTEAMLLANVAVRLKDKNMKLLVGRRQDGVPQPARGQRAPALIRDYQARLVACNERSSEGPLPWPKIPARRVPLSYGGRP